MTKMRETLKKFVTDESSFNTEIAKIISVDTATATCEVELLDEGITLTGIDMKVGESDDKGFFLVPKVNSIVLIELDNNTVLMYSELEKVVCKIEGTEMTLDKEGFKIEKDGVSLLSILSDLLDAIKTLTVTTSTGPSGTPINSPMFDQVKNNVKKLLK